MSGSTRSALLCLCALLSGCAADSAGRTEETDVLARATYETGFDPARIRQAAELAGWEELRWDQPYALRFLASDGRRFDARETATALSRPATNETWDLSSIYPPDEFAAVEAKFMMDIAAFEHAGAWARTSVEVQCVCPE